MEGLSFIGSSGLSGVKTRPTTEHTESTEILKGFSSWPVGQTGCGLCDLRGEK